MALASRFTALAQKSYRARSQFIGFGVHNMALDANIRGTTGTQMEVTANNRAKVELETDSANVAQIGCARVFGENDTGAFTGAA